MMHRNRKWSVINVLPSQLADMLVRNSWCLCVGFRCGDVYWLNDSTNEDAVQEFAVVRAQDLVQVESITVSWAGADDLVELAERFADASTETTNYGRIEAANLEHPQLCAHCA